MNLTDIPLVLKNPNRQAILELLSMGPTDRGALLEIMGISSNLLAVDLKIMRELGLIEFKRLEGGFRLYSMTKKYKKELRQIIKLIGICVLKGDSDDKGTKRNESI